MDLIKILQRYNQLKENALPGNEKFAAAIQLRWKCRQTKSKILKENADKQSQNTQI